MSQEDKEFLNLAGEIAVASELNRRQIPASVTYGASKRADVFAMNRDMTSVVRIEVKAATPKRQTRWLIGKKGTSPRHVPAGILWVFVLFPPSPNNDDQRADEVQRGAHAPRFFALTQKEVYQAFKKESEDYNRRRKEQGKGPFEGLGVPGVRLADIERHEGKWQKIKLHLQSPLDAPRGTQKQDPKRMSP